MTFDEIESLWQQCRTREENRALWERLARGGWLAACREAVQRGDRATIEAWLDESDAAKQAIIHFNGAEAAQMVRAHLLCALTALDHQQWTSGTVPADALQAIAAELQPSTLNPQPLGLSFLRDLTQELLGGQASPAQQQASLTALLVDTKHNSGVVATLTLELLPDGSGAIYPVVEQAFLPNPEFLGAVDNARRYQQQRLWRDGCDVRWRLSLRRNNSLIRSPLTGDSAGLAFALALRKLFDPESLELDGVAATGAVDSNGKVSKVGGLWEKLEDLRYLHTIVVPDEQDEKWLEDLRKRAESAWIIKAKDVADAVCQLNEQSLPRRAVREWEHERCSKLDILGKEVPIEKHYQALPLLREVKRERLPHEAMGRRGDEEQGGLRGVDIVRWEESLREEQVTYERHELDEVWSNFRQVVKEAKSDVPRFVGIGPPGGGKTTLEQYLAWRAANGDLRVLGRQLIPVRVRLREWEAWAVKSNEPDYSLADYLAAFYRQRSVSPAPTAAQWQRWLERGEVLLLLDGLDEISGNKSFLEALKNALTNFKDCPTVLTCRTVSYEQHKSVCPDLPVFTLSGLEDTQRDAYIRAFPAEHPDRYKPDALIVQLNRTPQMRPIAANPLLLSIICFVVDDPNGVTLPATRAELYDKAVDKLLTRVRVDEARSGLRTHRKRRILERAALTLFAGMEQQRQLTFDEASLLDALTNAAEQEGYRADPASVADALLDDLIHNSGLLRGSRDGGYFFLHLTLQEFLAACALAQRANTEGWQAIADFVDKKAWLPAYQEVIILLAGLLHDPTPLLELLADEKKDDHFRHRLALAALCLPELRDVQWKEQISSQLLQVLQYFADRQARFSHLDAASSKIWVYEGMRKTMPGLIVALLSTLPPIVGLIFEAAIKVAQRDLKMAAALSLWLAKQKVFVAEIVKNRRAAEMLFIYLEGLLQDERVKEEIRERKEEICDVLIRWLKHRNPQISLYASQMARLLASLCMTPALQEALIAALKSEDKEVAPRAARALMVGFADRDVPREVVNALINLVMDSVELSSQEAVPDSVFWAARCLAQFGQINALRASLFPSQHIINQILSSLRNYELKMLSILAAAPEAFHKELTVREVLSLLLKSLSDASEEVRFFTARTLEGASEQLIDMPQEDISRLSSAILQEQSAGVKFWVARALGRIGKRGATVEAITGLLKALDTTDPKVKLSREAARALDQIMAQGVRIFEGQDGTWKVRSVAELGE